MGAMSGFVLIGFWSKERIRNRQSDELEDPYWQHVTWLLARDIQGSKIDEEGGSNSGWKV